MLLGSLVALTLLFSVVSTVNPGYFAGLRAYADYAEKNDERSNQEDRNGANFVQTLGDHSEVAIKTGDNGAVLGVRVQGGDLQNGTQKVLLRGGSDAHYIPSGYLVYGVGGTLRKLTRFNWAMSL